MENNSDFSATPETTQTKLSKSFKAVQQTLGIRSKVDQIALIQSDQYDALPVATKSIVTGKVSSIVHIPPFSTEAGNPDYPLTHELAHIALIDSGIPTTKLGMIIEEGLAENIALQTAPGEFRKRVLKEISILSPNFEETVKKELAGNDAENLYIGGGIDRHDGTAKLYTITHIVGTNFIAHVLKDKISAWPVIIQNPPTAEELCYPEKYLEKMLEKIEAYLPETIIPKEIALASTDITHPDNRII